jgi:hypothetical protein
MQRTSVEEKQGDNNQRHTKQFIRPTRLAFLGFNLSRTFPCFGVTHFSPEAFAAPKVIYKVL